MNTTIDLQKTLAESTDVIAIYQLKFDRTTDMIRWLTTDQMKRMKHKKRGTATKKQEELLNNGHWPAP